MHRPAEPNDTKDQGADHARHDRLEGSKTSDGSSSPTNPEHLTPHDEVGNVSGSSVPSNDERHQEERSSNSGTSHQTTKFSLPSVDRGDPHRDPPTTKESLQDTPGNPGTAGSTSALCESWKSLQNTVSGEFSLDGCETCHSGIDNPSQVARKSSNSSGKHRHWRSTSFTSPFEHHNKPADIMDDGFNAESDLETGISCGVFAGVSTLEEDEHPLNEAHASLDIEEQEEQIWKQIVLCVLVTSLLLGGVIVCVILQTQRDRAHYDD